MLFGMFILGVVVGAIGIATIFMVYVGKIAKKYTTPPKDKIKVDSVNARLRKVQEITNEQLNMQSYTERPQKNSLDGKHKNRTINEMKRLEEEKREILQSILDDGFDPSISAIDETGEVKSMKLSEYMMEYGFAEPKKPEKQEKSTVTRKFTVHKGGKDNFDDDNNDNGSSH